MLVLSRLESESIVMPLSREVLQRMLVEHPDGCNLEVRVIKVKGNRTRLGVDAPDSVPVMRNELREGAS